jgi:hypothetical protein
MNCLRMKHWRMLANLRDCYHWRFKSFFPIDFLCFLRENSRAC